MSSSMQQQILNNLKQTNKGNGIDSLSADLRFAQFWEESGTIMAETITDAPHSQWMSVVECLYEPHKKLTLRPCTNKKNP